METTPNNRAGYSTAGGSAKNAAENMEHIFCIDVKGAAKKLWEGINEKQESGSCDAQDILLIEALPDRLHRQVEMVWIVKQRLEAEVEL